MSNLADSLFGSVPQDSNSEPIPGLADFLAANQIANAPTAPVTTKRATARQVAERLTSRLPSKRERPATSALFWLLAITVTCAFPPAALIFLWYLRIPPTATPKRKSSKPAKSRRRGRRYTLRGQLGRRWMNRLLYR